MDFKYAQYKLNRFIYDSTVYWINPLSLGKKNLGTRNGRSKGDGNATDGVDEKLFQRPESKNPKTVPPLSV